jgi:hypothetical protein
MACQLQCLPAAPRTLRLPQGPWQLGQGGVLASQKASAGGEWVQLPGVDGVAALALRRRNEKASGPTTPSVPVAHPVVVQRLDRMPGTWRKTIRTIPFPGSGRGGANGWSKAPSALAWCGAAAAERAPCGSRVLCWQVPPGLSWCCRSTGASAMSCCGSTFPWLPPFAAGPPIRPGA